MNKGVVLCNIENVFLKIKKHRVIIIPCSIITDLMLIEGVGNLVSVQCSKNLNKLCPD